MKIEFDFDVKNLKNSIEQSVLESIENGLQAAIGNMKCPTHKKDPMLRIQGHLPDDLTIEVTGCCEHFIKEVEDKIISDID